MTRRTYQFGITSVETHSQEFIDGINAGMQCYFDTEDTQEETLETSSKELVCRVLENMREERDLLDRGRVVAKEWQVGFVVGSLAAMLHPDVRLHAPSGIEHIEMLSQRCQQLYHEYRNTVENEIA